MADAEKETGSQAGLSDQDGPAFLVVGRIGRPHGVRGEVSFQVMTDFPDRLVPGRRVYIGRTHTEMTIAGLRGSPARRILRLEGLSDRDRAGLLRNQLVHVRTADLPPLPEDEFYAHQLIGLEVHTADGLLGEVAEILSTGANDVLLVRSSAGEERLLPAIEEVLLEVDLAARRITVALLPGL